VYRNGHIEAGRDVDIIGAHCEGHNAHSIGVCYIGGCARDGRTPKDTRTLAQKAALISVLTELRQMYPQAKIYGHRDFDKHGKKCPSFDAKEEYKKI
jgi:N-acetylmuramoyl-L-alanine amidase